MVFMHSRHSFGNDFDEGVAYGPLSAPSFMRVWSMLTDFRSARLKICFFLKEQERQGEPLLET